MNRTILLPIIALLALFAQRLFHIEWSDQDMQIISDGLLSIAAMIGIFMNPKKTDQ